MKKWYVAVAATLIATSGFSQVHFGLQVTGNASSASVKADELDGLSSKMRMGFGAGAVADISFGKSVSLRPSLNYMQKNGNIEYSSALFPGKTFAMESNLSYLELPVNILYKLPLKNAMLFAGAGPSFGYGIAGKIKLKGWEYEAVEGDQVPEILPVNTSIKAFKKEEDDGAEMKRFDFSANAIAGVQFKNGLYVNAGYLFGFTNLIKDGGSYKNRSIQLTVGFLLPGKGLF